jgi:uncharacterized OB-fold protein
MGLEKFGTVSFTSEAKASAFVDYLEEGKVMTTRCRQCGGTFFPPKADCPKCLSDDVEWIEIKGTGKLATYTIVNYGPSGFEDDAPYALAIVDFDGLRVFGRLSKNIAEADMAVGMELKLAPAKLAGDKVAYEFQRI